MQLGPVRYRQVHVRQGIDLALVDERCELGPFAAELISDVA